MKYLTLVLCAVSLYAAAPSGSPSGCVNATTGVITTHPCVATYTTAGSTSTTGEVVWLEAGLNSWNYGDTVKAQAGKIWQKSSRINVAKPGGTYTGTDALFTTTRDSELPLNGTRITLNYMCATTVNGCQTGTLADFSGSVVPIFWGTSNVPIVGLAHGVAPGDNIAADHITLRGLGFYRYEANFNTVVFSSGFLEVGDNGTLGVISDAATQQPSHITVQHCILSQSGTFSTRVMLNLNGNDVTIRDNFIERGQTYGQDSQAINGTSGLGPYYIYNNYAEGGAENILFGGGRPSYTSLFSSNVNIKWNFLPKSPNKYQLTRWAAGTYHERGAIVWSSTGTSYTVSPGSHIALNSGTTGSSEPTWCTTGTCTDPLDGTIQWQRTGVQQWLLKNSLEVKSGTDWDVQYNVTENLWANPGGQETAINFKIETKGLTEGFNCAEYLSGTVNVASTIVTKAGGDFPDIMHPGATSAALNATAVNTTTNILSMAPIPGSGWNASRQVYLTTTGTLPGGLTANTIYYLRTFNATTDSFALATTDSDTTIVDITSAGSGTLTAHLLMLDGLSVRINGVFYTVASYQPPNQLTLTTSAGTQSGVPMTIGDPTGECHGSWNKRMLFANNWVRNAPQGFKITCGVNGRESHCSDHTVRNNLFTNIGKTLMPDFAGAASPTAFAAMSMIQEPQRLLVEHNTFIGTNPYALNYEIGSLAQDARYTDGVYRNNLFISGQTNGFRASGAGVEGAGLNNALCGGATCTTANWNKNAFVGLASTSTYVAGTTLNPTTTTVGFLNYVPNAGGLYDLAPGTTYYNAGTDGRQIGVDMDQIPRIMGLTVVTSDRAATFVYRVSPGVASIPCVVEVSTTRDMLTPVSYLQTFDGRNSDAFNSYPRPDGRRRIVVTGLSAATTYWYRLQCGGDATYDQSFTTSGTLTGTASQAIVFTSPTNGTQTLTWGTTYNATTNAISGGGAPTATCTLNQACSIAFTGNRGQPYFYKVNSGNVDVVTIP